MINVSSTISLVYFTGMLLKLISSTIVQKQICRCWKSEVEQKMLDTLTSTGCTCGEDKVTWQRYGKQVLTCRQRKGGEGRTKGKVCDCGQQGRLNTKRSVEPAARVH